MLFINTNHYLQFIYAFIWFYINILIYYLLDINSELNYKFRYLNKYKINKKKINWEKYKKTFIFVGKQFICINYPLSYIFHKNVSINSSNLILLNELLKLCFCVIFSDIYFYILHNIFHTKYLYFIHKKHHEWIVPNAISTTYSHIIEHIFLNILSIYLPLLIINAHIYTYIIYQTLGILLSISDHSNYNFINSIHSIHHQKFKYNFGLSIGISDIIFNKKIYS